MSMFLYRLRNLAERFHAWREACKCMDRMDASRRADGYVEMPPGSPLVISRWVKVLQTTGNSNA
jgi:hypothetical protein